MDDNICPKCKTNNVDYIEVMEKERFGYHNELKCNKCGYQWDSNEEVSNA